MYFDTLAELVLATESSAAKVGYQVALMDEVAGLAGPTAFKPSRVVDKSSFDDIAAAHPVNRVVEREAAPL